MRTTILFLLLLPAAGRSADPPAGDRETRVRVALAVAGTNQCGECRFDEDKCRAEALAGNKPLVLFVGESCAKLGAVARKAGAVACVVEGYPHDGRPAAEPRAVVLSPNPAGGWFREGTVLSPTETSVKAAVEKATPKAAVAKALDWDTK